MSDQSIAIFYAIILLLTIFGISIILTRWSNESYERKLEICFYALEHRSTLADSLEVAQKFKECEWWNQPRFTAPEKMEDHNF